MNPHPYNKKNSTYQDVVTQSSEFQPFLFWIRSIADLKLINDFLKLKRRSNAPIDTKYTLKLVPLWREYTLSMADTPYVKRIHIQIW